MKKLIKGIVDFRQKALPSYRETFAKLALGQSPDTLFIACSDSRVAPNLFASTNPGDLFVIRNVGNLIPTCNCDGISDADESEAAAIEYAITTLNVPDIIVCGHSGCGAMNALVEGREKIAGPNLRAWLRHGDASLTRTSENNGLSRADQVSQQNVLQQLEHLRSYPIIKERLAKGQVSLHGWWFDLRTVNVYAFDETAARFILIDEEHASQILNR